MTVYLVIGVVVGSVYGIAAMGLVLSYKTSGVFNFGHGAIAAVATFIFFDLHQRHGLDWPLAALISVVGFGAVAGLIMEYLARGLAGLPTQARVVATVGIIVFVVGLMQLIFGPASLSFKSFLPQQVDFTLSGVQITRERIITIVFGLVAALTLYVFFRRTYLGTAMRAVVDDPHLLDLTGVAPARIRRISWLIGCMFAAISGLLFASTEQQLDATLLSLLVVQAFGAAAIGAFTSLPLAYAGGLFLGVAQALISNFESTHPSLTGLDQVVPFIALFAVLIFYRSRSLVELGEFVRTRSASSARLLSQRMTTATYAGVAVIAVIIPLVVGTKLPSWNAGMAQLVLFLSLGLLVRTSGQISLCQWGFAAIGGATLGHLLGHGVPWLIAVLIAGLAAVPAGAIVAIPAIRRSGLYLALATLGFGVVLEEFVYNRGFLFGIGGGLTTGRPHVFGLETDKGYYYAMLAIVVVCIGLVVAIERSRLGRLLRGLADSPVALTTLGANVNVTRVIVFCTSSFLAGISGALLASLYGQVNQDSYNYFSSVTMLAVLFVCGRTTVSASIVAVLLSVVLPGYIQGQDFSEVLQMLFGLSAILFALMSQGRFGSFFGALAVRSGGRAAGSRLRSRSSDAAEEMRSQLVRA
jgi:branched-subunit amino acid ABC-type transport system permease component